MLSLFLKTIYLNRKKLVLNVLITTLFNWMFVAMFPAMQKEADKLTEAFAAYPEDFLKVFNIDMENILTTLENFMQMENFSILWPIVAIILIISIGSPSIAGEVDDGTLEVLLAQPLSRLKIFISKYLGGLVIIFLFVFLSIFSTIPFAILHNVDYQVKSYLFISIIGFLFSLAIYSSTFMLSSISSTRGRPSSIISGMLLLMYAINIIVSFRESAEKLKYLSFFYYYDYKAAMIDFKIGLLNIMVFVMFSIVCTVVGSVAFTKRDIAT